MNKEKVVCIIPARSGSKGLSNKNLLKINNIPLIAYPIKAAIASNEFENIFVSTDSVRIASIAKKYGADVPFLRPKKFAADLTSTEDTLKQALISYENFLNKSFTICVYLTATDIFRKISWIKQAVKTLKDNPNIESCFSANSTHKNYWFENKKNNWKRILPSMKEYSSRQIKKPIYREDTGLACASRSFLWRKGKRIGNKVKLLINNNQETNIDIHSKYDLYVAKKTIEYFKKNDPNKLPNSR